MLCVENWPALKAKCAVAEASDHLVTHQAEPIVQGSRGKGRGEWQGVSKICVVYNGLTTLSTFYSQDAPVELNEFAWFPNHDEQ